MYRREVLARSMCLIAAPLVQAGRCRLQASDSPAYSTRAIDLVEQSNVIDMLGLLTFDWPLLERWRSHPESFSETDFRNLQNSGIDVFYPAVAFDDASCGEISTRWMESWNRFLSARAECFVRIDGVSDLDRPKREGKIGIVLGMQDANYIASVSDVDRFYAMGQRVMQLTYNFTNRLGHGCMTEDRGLTAFGHEVVERMNGIGMAVDLSHCGERTTLEAIEASQKPVLITHSNCKALAPSVPRCKSDAVIRAASQRGGVIGLTAVRHFVRASDPVTIEDALDHFDYAVKLVGVEHVGVGSDLDLHGRDTNSKLRYDIAGLNHPRRMYDLVEGLIRRGYTNEHVQMILGGNFRRVLGEIWVPTPTLTPLLSGAS